MAVLIHVFFGEREGVRVMGTNHVIYKDQVDSFDWDVYMELIEIQKASGINGR